MSRQFGQGICCGVGWRRLSVSLGGAESKSAPLIQYLLAAVVILERSKCSVPLVLLALEIWGSYSSDLKALPTDTEEQLLGPSAGTVAHWRNCASSQVSLGTLFSRTCLVGREGLEAECAEATDGMHCRLGTAHCLAGLLITVTPRNAQWVHFN